MLRISEPTLLGREEEYVLDALRTRSLSMGRYVERFEKLAASSMGAAHAVAVSSGTAALHVALLALGVKRRDRVVVPACSYIATANAVRYCGADPVFVDVRHDDWMLDPLYTMQHTIRSGAVGIIAVNLYGGVCSLPRVQGVWVLEDSCEAHGLALRGRAATLSFYGNKVVTCGEGGAVVTDNPALAEAARIMRGQGTTGKRRYWHEEVGYNYRLTDLQAALGCAQVEKIGEHLAKRRALRKAYDEMLPAGVETQRRQPAAIDWVMPVLVRHRDSVAASLAESGIETRPVFPALHTQPQYRTMQHLPVAERLAADGLLLPLHLGMTEGDVERVCSSLERAIRTAA